MADRYIDAQYVRQYLGSAVVDSLTSDDVEDADDILGTLIEAATASVQTDLRNSGYDTPSDAVGDGATMGDPFVRMATMGTLWPLLTGRPDVTVALPDGWDEHPANVARAQIHNGRATLTLSRAAIGAVGGMKATDSSVYTSTGQPPRATRANLVGY